MSRRRSIRNVFTNWERSDLPFLERLAVALRNSWRRVARVEACCGHPGEPGC